MDPFILVLITGLYIIEILNGLVERPLFRISSNSFKQFLFTEILLQMFPLRVVCTVHKLLGGLLSWTTFE